MKRTLVASMLFAAVSAGAAIEISSPAEGETVKLLNEKQRAFMRMTREERGVFFDDSRPDKEREIKSWGSDPLPVRVEWSGAGGAKVKVTKKGEAKPFFEADVPSNRVDVWNLEVAAGYEVTVCANGECARRSFKTEDLAPRLIRIPRVPNIRDMGGRVTMDGRRVKQGLAFRSSGLNNNAKVVYYTMDELRELEKAGKLASMGKLGAKYSAKFKRGTGPDPKRLRLIKVMPTEPGTPRLTEEWRAYMCDVLGIKTDIDLRSDLEVCGMKVSPLGPGVKFVREWENYYDYASIHTRGKEATLYIFRLLTDPSVYPVDFHCIGGADRTGTIATLLHGILGASDEDIRRDYQITAWQGGVNDARHLGWFESFLKSLERFEGETISDRVRAYFRDAGFSDAEMEKIRDVFLR